MTQIITSLSEISERYDAILCDLWGCLHNGLTPFPAAEAALAAFRAKGGSVILLTNAPRPADGVRKHLTHINVDANDYDGVISSGDAATAALASGMFGTDVYHIGPDRDLPFFENTNTNRVPLEKAESIVCTGLFDDETETPEDYKATVLYGKNKGLKLLCANPDIVVDRGDKRIYCAGAIAQAYTIAGGESLYFGKPHPPIYALARQMLTDLRGTIVDDERILCVGDGIKTDVPGGINEGMDTLFITGGLSKETTGTDQQPDPDLLASHLGEVQLSPTAAMGYLR